MKPTKRKSQREQLAGDPDEIGYLASLVTSIAIAWSVSFRALGVASKVVRELLLSKSPKSKKYPAAHIEGEWFLDKEAASRLNSH